jgi:hypothetical protein
MAVPFDTHETIPRLQQAGFPPGQAEALSDTLKQALNGSQSHLATKADLDATKADLRTEIEKVRTEIQTAKNSILMWTIGVLGSMYVIGMVLLYNLLARPLKP